MKPNPPSKDRGLATAKHMKNRLLQEGIPVIQVLLFGSLAKGTPRQWSDIDLAVIHEPFGADRFEEQKRVGRVRDDFSIPMDIICFHPEDMENIYSTIVQEVKKFGISV